MARRVDTDCLQKTDTLLAYLNSSLTAVNAACNT